MLRMYWLLAIGYFALFVELPVAAAAHPIGLPPWEEGVSLAASISYSSVNAMERVYEDSVRPGYVVSELDWKADVALAGISSSIRHERWVANGGIWTSLDTIDGSLVDRDWRYTDIPDWSDQSIGDASLDMTVFDINVGYGMFKAESMALDVVLGYRQDELGWSDFGGTYLYSIDGFRDTAGTLPPGTAITYDQKIQIPYLGLHAHTRIRPAMTLSGYLLYSTLGEISAHDYHILRGVHFVDSFSGVEYLGVGVLVSWNLTPELLVGVTLDYQNLDDVVGDEQIIEYGEFRPDGAGTSMESTTASVMVCYAF